MTHFTIIFQTFIFMQIFNSINCRKLGMKEYNVFSGFFNNWLFLMILGIEILVQLIMVEWFGSIVQATPLTNEMNASCIVLGAGTLIVATALKVTPAQWVERIPFKIDENKKFDENDAIMGGFNKIQGKAPPTI